jgi:hypothetical protein
MHNPDPAIMTPDIPHKDRPIEPVSETSPLLPKPTGDAQVIDVQTGIAPEGVHAEDGGDVERQVSHGDAFKHQGLPEVRKRMKYIFPAIAIGVSFLCLSRS